MCWSKEDSMRNVVGPTRGNKKTKLYFSKKETTKKLYREKKKVTKHGGEGNEKQCKVCITHACTYQMIILVAFEEKIIVHLEMGCAKILNQKNRSEDFFTSCLSRYTIISSNAFARMIIW